MDTTDGTNVLSNETVDRQKKLGRLGVQHAGSGSGWDRPTVDTSPGASERSNTQSYERNVSLQERSRGLRVPSSVKKRSGQGLNLESWATNNNGQPHVRAAWSGATVVRGSIHEKCEHDTHCGLP